MKKLRNSLLVLASSTLALSACAGFQTSDNSEGEVNEEGKTVVDFWSFWGSL